MVAHAMNDSGQFSLHLGFFWPGDGIGPGWLFHTSRSVGPEGWDVQMIVFGIVLGAHWVRMSQDEIDSYPL
jgi:hypothetical protein